MHGSSLLATAAVPTIEIVRDIREKHLDAATPCSEFTVRQLINHLLFWGPSLEGAARRESVRRPADNEREVDLTDGDWAVKLETNIDRLVTAWGAASAWEGSASMGAQEMPASFVGGMVVTELVVHGWDLGRATSQAPIWDDDILDFVLREVVNTAELGRQGGVYGPEVAVPAGSSTLDHLLGLTGRDPRWTPFRRSAQP